MHHKRCVFSRTRCTGFLIQISHSMGLMFGDHAVRYLAPVSAVNAPWMLHAYLAGNVLNIRCWTTAPLTTLKWSAPSWLGLAPHKGHHFPYVSLFSSSTAWKPAAIRSLDRAHNPASMICLIHILNQSIEVLSMRFFFSSGWYWQMGLITLKSRGLAYFFAIKPCCFLGFLPITRLQSEILISLLKSHTVRFSL